MCGSVNRTGNGNGHSEKNRVQESRASAIGWARLTLAWEAVTGHRSGLGPSTFQEGA